MCSQETCQDGEEDKEQCVCPYMAVVCLVAS